jgi:hypothetical protein
MTWLNRLWYRWQFYLLMAAVWALAVIYVHGWARVGSGFLCGLCLGMALAAEILDLAKQSLDLAAHYREELVALGRHDEGDG